MAAADDADLIIAAGGDGLINEVAGGMVDKKAMFTALPFGTVNVFCRQFKIPLKPLEAVEKINPDGVKRLPVGFLNSRPFVLMCGFGYDAQVVRRVVEKGYSSNKTFAHIKEGMGSLFAKYPLLSIYVNGRQYTAPHVIVSLVPYYAGSFSLSKQIRPDILNVMIMKEQGAFSLIYSAMNMAVGQGLPVHPLHGTAVKISGSADAQLDGEYVKTQNMQNYITIKPSAIAAVV
jgi:diacylglycerol kinase family enzyme